MKFGEPDDFGRLNATNIADTNDDFGRKRATSSAGQSSDAIGRKRRASGCIFKDLEDSCSTKSGTAKLDASSAMCFGNRVANFAAQRCLWQSLVRDP